MLFRSGETVVLPTVSITSTGTGSSSQTGGFGGRFGGGGAVFNISPARGG